VGGNNVIGAAAKYNTRTPGGHPEGYIEAFANIYRNFHADCPCQTQRRTADKRHVGFPQRL